MTSELSSADKISLLGLLAQSYPREFKLTFLKILAQSGSAENALAEIETWAELDAGCQEILSKLQQPPLLSKFKNWQADGIKLLSPLDELYPAEFKNLYEVPLVLFAKGNLSILQEESIAIVGARRAEVFSCSFAAELASKFSSAGLHVVSGLALGIDTAAHQAVLDNKALGKTIAVLGGGLNDIYPATNRRLAAQIIQAGGCLLSEYAPEERPRPYHFVNRNRLIAALSQAVCLVQAGKKSGSLITAQFATDLGREIYVAPGDLRNSSYAGSNQLIRQGAHLITCPADVLEFSSRQRPEAEKVRGSEEVISGLQYKESLIILKELQQQGRMSIDELSRATGSSGCLHLALLELELAGIIKAETGGSVVLVAYS